MNEEGTFDNPDWKEDYYGVYYDRADSCSHAIALTS